MYIYWYTVHIMLNNFSTQKKMHALQINLVNAFLAEGLIPSMQLLSKMIKALTNLYHHFAEPTPYSESSLVSYQYLHRARKIIRAHW